MAQRIKIVMEGDTPKEFEGMTMEEMQSCMQEEFDKSSDHGKIISVEIVKE